MKILVGSWPGYGHLLPMVPLIRAAQRGGHEVVVTSGSDMAGLVENLGVTAHPTRLRAEIEQMPAADVVLDEVLARIAA
jgi:UDP:flavonoid glycosyltransferase YjiC (YdhE family)